MANPGQVTHCRDFSKRIREVYGAESVWEEIMSIDLSQPGYTVSVEMENDPVCDDEGDDDD
ncbi:hypothetical protein Q31b_57730 [Novipirellula aureliae]|uniref:Uncharacterized protein n=1 Tax=Novipirellula aureliae TaxID=2527966 RepID=A0A5C6DE13_9BACT|nr:hypothetical protein Q31b_57730 [Novipirellula aureliae]